MLDIPFLQPVTAPTRAQPSADRQDAESKSGNSADAAFEAEYDSTPASPNDEPGTDTSNRDAIDPDSGDEADPPKDNSATSDAQKETVTDVAEISEVPVGRDKEDPPVFAAGGSDQKAPTPPASTLGAPEGQSEQSPRAGSPALPVGKTAFDDRDAQNARQVAQPASADTNTKVTNAAGTTTQNLLLSKVTGDRSGLTKSPTAPASGVDASGDTGEGNPSTLARPKSSDQMLQSTPPQGLTHGAKTAGRDEKYLQPKSDPADLTTVATPKTPSPKAPSHPPLGAMTLSNIQGKIIPASDKADSVLAPIGDIDTAAAVETRTGSTPGAANIGQGHGRVDTPAAIARQMAEALQKLPDRPVEIALNPKELGRVRMSISPVEAGIIVNVIAERPETLDLMRRNIDQLSREFESMGYSDIGFAFAEGEAQQSFDEHGGDTSDHSYTFVEADTQVLSDTPPDQVITATSGVDIRL